MSISVVNLACEYNFKIYFNLLFDSLDETLSFAIIIIDNNYFDLSFIF